MMVFAQGQAELDGVPPLTTPLKATSHEQITVRYADPAHHQGGAGTKTSETLEDELRTINEGWGDEDPGGLFGPTIVLVVSDRSVVNREG